jgi:hypothetical protein
MTPIEHRTFNRWAMMLSSIAISICSAMIGLRCLQIFGDNSIKPIAGCVVYLIGTLVLCLSFFVQRRSVAKYVKGISEKKSLIIVNIESLSDSILRWLISGIAAIFGLLNIGTAMICIYNLPDKTSRPLYGVIFVLVSILFICSLFLRLWKKRLQYNKQNPDFISNAVVYDRSEKDSRTQLSEAIQQWISVVSVIVVSFIGVLAAYTCMYSLPDKVSRPFIGSLFYLISAAALGSFFIQQWRGAKSFLAYGIDNMGDRIIIRECFSEKLRKWILAIYVAGYTLLSIATAILCLFFGLPDRSVRPDAAVFFLFSGISAITMLTYSLWKNQSGRRFIDPTFKGL